MRANINQFKSILWQRSSFQIDLEAYNWIFLRRSGAAADALALRWTFIWQKQPEAVLGSRSYSCAKTYLQERRHLPCACLPAHVARRLRREIKRMGSWCKPVHMLESSYISPDLHCRPAVKMQCGASLKWATEENQRVLMFFTLREGNNDQQRDNNEFHRVMECCRRPPSLSLCLYLHQRILAVFLRVGQTKRLGHFFWRSFVRNIFSWIVPASGLRDISVTEINYRNLCRFSQNMTSEQDIRAMKNKKDFDRLTSDELLHLHSCHPRDRCRGNKPISVHKDCRHKIFHENNIPEMCV